MSNENYLSDMFQSSVLQKSYYQILQESNMVESQVIIDPNAKMAQSQLVRGSLYPFEELDDEHDSEDEGIEDYHLGGYHPVHIGEILLSRYVTIQKLGWGHFSTVWLCKDFKYDTYVAIKVQKSAENYLEAAYDEVEILQKVAQKVHNLNWTQKLREYKSTQSITRDDSHVIQLLNSFVFKGPYGRHFCMVFEILGVNLLEIIKQYKFKGLPLSLCQKIAKETLIGLEFLHEVCGVIHTDLKPENVLLQLSKQEIEEIIDNGQLTANQLYKERLAFYHKQLGIEGPKLTKTQKRNQQRRKKNKGKEEDLFKMNQQISFQKLKTDFSIKVADLGNACWTHHHFSTLIQTRQYRSPEVLLGSAYNCTADMWSLACMIFELITGDFMFEPRKGANFSKNDDHLAQMQELIGRFPPKFSLRGLKAKRYFDSQGTMKRIPTLNCWALQNVLIEKYKFKLNVAKSIAAFLGPMLIPYPERRIFAKDALQNAFLQINFDDDSCKMTDEEYQLYSRTKLPIVYQQKIDTEEEDASDSEDERDEYIKGPRKADPHLIDKSFTDLGYLGYGDGIDLGQLDATGNWQFENQNQ